MLLQDMVCGNKIILYVYCDDNKRLTLMPNQTITHAAALSK